MKILTPRGLRDPADMDAGDEVLSRGVLTGRLVCNRLETRPQWIDRGEFARWWNWRPPAFRFFRINGHFTFSRSQSIWANGFITHVAKLKVGDVIYTERDGFVRVLAIEEVLRRGWWRFDVDGDHSYVLDGTLVHNASRFRVSGTGTWDATTTTGWGSASGTADNSSVPGAADAVTFDGSSGGGTCTVNTTVTVQSIAMQAFTGTLDFSANNNNVTLSANSNAFNCSGSATRTLKMGNGAWTLTTTNASGQNVWNIGNTTNLTFQANGSTINFSGVSVAGGGGRWFTSATSGSAIAYNNLTFSGAGNYILNTAALNLALNALAIGGQVNLLLNVITCTVTSIATTTTPTTPASIGGQSAGTQYTISCASGIQNLSNIAVKDAAFSGGATFKISGYDLGNNSGAAFSLPPVAQIVSAQRGSPY